MLIDTFKILVNVNFNAFFYILCRYNLIRDPKFMNDPFKYSTVPARVVVRGF